VADDGSSTWTLYDAGPRTVRCPLLLLPPVSGRAEVFFQQMLALSSLGYRVISVCVPLYYYEHIYSHRCRQERGLNKNKQIHYMQDIHTGYSRQNEQIILSFFSCSDSITFYYISAPNTSNCYAKLGVSLTASEIF